MDIDTEWTMLANLKSLNYLSIAGCKFSPQTVKNIRQKLPHVTLVTSEIEVTQPEDTPVWFEIQQHDVIRLFYKNDQLSEYFYHSMPRELMENIE